MTGPIVPPWSVDDRGETAVELDVRNLGSDADNVEQDLTRLVLTLVELIRQLVERQCVRRMDAGNLTDGQVEAMGLALMRLEDTMEELRGRFGLTPEDLNIDLGPLGTLLPASRE